MQRGWITRDVAAHPPQGDDGKKKKYISVLYTTLTNKLSQNLFALLRLLVNRL